MAGERILIIEDEEALREILTEVLHHEGYEVHGEAEPQSALNRSKEGFFNVVLSDLRLSGGDGLETLAQIKKIHEDTCGIIMTGYASAKTAVAALEKGVYDYLIKPLDMERVKDVIAKGIKRQYLEIENKRLLATLGDENKKLEAILQMGEMTSSLLDVEKLASFVVDRISLIIGCQRVSLMLLGDDGYLRIKAAKGLDEKTIMETRVKLGEEISGYVAQNGNPFLVDDIETHPIFHKKSDPRYTSKSFVSIPLIYRDKVTGVINIIDKISSPPVFNEKDTGFLSIIAQHVAIAVENARLFEEKSRLAITDGLTGLYNHRHFNEHLEEEIKRLRRYPHPLSLVMIDIDHFKNYNDAHGHLKGDDVLRGIANIFRENVREIDIVARYGGEEFSFILFDTDIEGGYNLAEKTRRAVEEKPFELEASQPGGKLTISLGVADFKKEIKTREELIDQADKALYRAKQEGRNRVCIYNSGRREQG